MSAFPRRKSKAAQNNGRETVSLLLFHLGNSAVDSGNPDHKTALIWYICSVKDRTESRRGGEHMAKKERFVEVYSQGVVNVAKVIVDRETGVNYLMASHNLRVGTGLTVLVDQDGKPVVTPID